uniref:Uncharacterized protein n=1 Tax=Ailuropoda melanoleuca TaxID=9646 RepID=A0A7N5JF60_AILME
TPTFESDHIIVSTVTSRSPWLFVKKGLFCTSWRCHLRSLHRTGKRCYSLPAHVSMSEAHSHVDHGGGHCPDFLWRVILPLYVLNAPRAL